MQFGNWQWASRLLGALLITVLGVACEAGGNESFTGKVDRTRLASVVAVRAVQGTRVVAQGPVAADGAFHLALPKGQGYRLELVTRNAARPVAFGARRTLTFDVCEPAPDCDIGTINGPPAPPAPGDEPSDDPTKRTGGHHDDEEEEDEDCNCSPGDTGDEEEDEGDWDWDDWGDEYPDQDGDGDCSDDWNDDWGDEYPDQDGDDWGDEYPDPAGDECSPADPACFGAPVDPCEPMPVDLSDQAAILDYVQCWLDVLESGGVDVGGVVDGELPDLGCE